MNRATEQQRDHQELADYEMPAVQAGRYEVRFARTAGEIRGAQALRYRTLYVENQGRVTADMLQSGREEDEWDPIAQHVIVLDRSKLERPVVGTLRLVSKHALAPTQSFYTEHAYDISNLRARYSRILELSRFCIDKDGRSGAILMLIWKYTMQFIVAQRYELMLGCASFPGADIERHRCILTYLYRNNLAPAELQSRPVAGQSVPIRELLDDAGEWEEAKQAVPTLLRGYLKVGAKIADSAIIDPVFNTVFVGIYVDARDMVVQNHTLVRY